MMIEGLVEDTMITREITMTGPRRLGTMTDLRGSPKMRTLRVSSQP